MTIYQSTTPNRCKRCRHYHKEKALDGFEHPMGICLNTESPHKAKYRYPDNFCLKFEPITSKSEEE